MRDTVFHTALGNNAYLVFVGMPLYIVWSLLVAFLLNINVRGLPLFRTIYLLPAIMPTVAATFVWLWVLNPRTGVGYYLNLLGITPPLWYEDPQHLVPEVWKLSNYPQAMTYVPFLLYLRNSLTICAGVIVGTLLSCTLVAYSLSRVRWFGRGPLFAVVLATMMLPGQVTMIPLFMLFRGSVGSTPTIPGGAGLLRQRVLHLPLMRQFFLTIRASWRTRRASTAAASSASSGRIMMPLSKRRVRPRVAIFTFTWAPGTTSWGR